METREGHISKGLQLTQIPRRAVRNISWEVHERIRCHYISGIYDAGMSLVSTSKCQIDFTETMVMAQLRLGDSCSQRGAWLLRRSHLDVCVERRQYNHIQKDTNMRIHCSRYCPNHFQMSPPRSNTADPRSMYVHMDRHEFLFICHDTHIPLE